MIVEDWPGIPKLKRASNGAVVVKSSKRGEQRVVHSMVFLMGDELHDYVLHADTFDLPRLKYTANMGHGFLAA